eukprot:2699985-Prymnesium_polylepis.2
MQVRRVLSDGRFQACVYDVNGRPDEDFIEWYSKKDEGKDWRRRSDDTLQPEVDPRVRAAMAKARKLKRKRSNKW